VASVKCKDTVHTDCFLLNMAANVSCANNYVIVKTISILSAIAAINFI